MRQLHRETQAQTEAKQRLEATTRKAHERSYASSTVSSQALIKQRLAGVAGQIEKRMGALTSGRAGMDAATIVKHLKDTDHSVLALITMKVALDVLGKETNPKIPVLTIAVGSAVETQLRLDWYHSQNPQLYNFTENSFHGSTGTRQRATVFRLKFNREGINWPAWSRTVKHKIGAHLINCLCIETQWLEKKTVTRPKSRESVWSYSNEFLGMRDSIMERASQLAFCQWPMLCEPVPWTNEEPGGYLTESIRQTNPLIRKSGAMKVGGSKQGSIPLDMLNNLQRTRYRINPKIFAVAEHLYENFISVGKFQRAEAKPPPPSPGENATEEQVKSYKIDRKRIEDYNAQLQQKNWRTTEAMYVARKYKDEPWFTCPASFDYRGRVYFLNTALHSQGTDFDKALLCFAEEGPVNEWWEAFNVATCFGHDKASMADRVQWTRDNTDLITRVAQHPLSTIDIWGEASEPFLFLAACFSYHETCIAKTKSTSGCCISIDATCSGIQHLAAMSLDYESGVLCNLVPTPKPSDGYKAVAEASKRWIEPQYHEWMTRSVVKRSTMTRVYSAAMHSSRGYLRDALLKDGRDLSAPGLLTQITKAVYQKAQPAVFPGPMKLMDWFQKTAREALKTRDHLEWTSPSGFRVIQDLRKSKSRIVKTRLMGQAIQTTIADGWGDPDIDHHLSAVAPNVVHAADSALLHRVFTSANWNKPFTCIHDCCLARGCDLDDLSRLIREEFVQMYSQPFLQNWAEEMGTTVPDDLIQNTLDITHVRDSLYFFC